MGSGGVGVLVIADAVVLGTGEVVSDQHAGPFASFGFVGGGDDDLGVWFGGQVGDRGEDGVGAVGVDEVDQGLQVAAGGVVGGVVLQVAPAGEEDEFGVVGAAAFFQVAGCEGQGLQAVSSAGQGDSVAGGHEGHDLGHGADVGAAQDGVRLGDGAKFGGHSRSAGQADRGVGQAQPPVGLVGEVGAEAEGPGQGQLGAVEPGHDVFGAAPLVDGLGRVADHDQLGVLALGEEDLFDHGVGVLGLVEQQEARVDAGLGEGPDFEVVVVVEADGAVVGVLRVGPGFAGERHDVGGELGVEVGVFQAAQVGHVVAGDGFVGGVAEECDSAQSGIGEGFGVTSRSPMRRAL